MPDETSASLASRSAHRATPGRELRRRIFSGGLAGSALLLAALGSGCRSLPAPSSTPATLAPTDTAGTVLGQAIAPDLARHPGASGFHPLTRGADAFVARLALARAAERTLDLQYYLFLDDQTGRALLGELVLAAARGVRVRLLIDDIRTAGRDEALAALATLPNFEVRIFNPFARRSARWLDFVTDFRRVNRRMHNKAFIADNQAAIVGGRNIGDEYFAARPDVDFSDLDLLALGPVVADVSAVFDAYWNSDAVRPIASLHPQPPDEATLRRLRETFLRELDDIRATPYARGLADTDLARSLRERQLPLHWGPASVIADQPEKISRPPSDDSTHALPHLDEFLAGAREELLLVSPYFVPGKEGVRALADAARRGLRVRILTNSFLATDVRAVHAGYAPYRRRLLEAGVEIYELKPTALAALPEDEKHADSPPGSSRASLHAKTYLVDGKSLFVGSLNLDPRSIRLNTEMGIILESPALCADLRAPAGAEILDFSYRVELAPDSNDLVWTTREDGREVRLTREPGVGPLDRVGLWFLRILPVEEQL